jgi:hypothetical protein
VGIPIAAFNLVVFGSALVHYANAMGAELPSFIGAFALAEGSALGFLFGRSALISPFALTIPILCPTAPIRFAIGRLTVATMALLAAVGSALFVTEYLPSVEALSSFASFSADRLQERPSGDFALGVRLLPEIRRAPSPSALGNDLALVDSLSPDVVELFVTPEGTRGAALDSASRALDYLRRDSVLVVLALGYDNDDRELARNPASYARLRLEAVDRAVRRLRPDIFLPARDPGELGLAMTGPLSSSWWTTYLRNAADHAKALRPRTRVGVSVSAFSSLDSIIFAWAKGPQSPLDVVGFSFAPSYGGGNSLAARMRVAGQWGRDSSRPLWVFSVGANPRVFGEVNQARAVWSVLAWATAEPKVQGVIVDGAADYDTLIGMRSPDGRLRNVVATFDRARRSLAEASSVRP